MTCEVQANVEKHAHATRSPSPPAPGRTRHRASSQRVRLVVTDNGVGADPRALTVSEKVTLAFDW